MRRTETINQNCIFICHNFYNPYHVTKNSNTIMLCQSKFFNSSTTPMASSSFAWPNNAMYLSTATNPIASSSFMQPINSIPFSTGTSPTISSLIKARTEHHQADIYPQDIAIDMSLEEKSDDLIDLIAKFEKIEIVGEMDWKAIQPRTDNHQAENFPQDIAIDMNLEEKSDDLMDLITIFEKMEIADKMDWKAF